MQLIHGKPPSRAALLPSQRNPTRKWRFLYRISHRDSESLQASGRIGMQEPLAGCLQGMCMKVKDGIISSEEESKYTSLLSNKILLKIGAAVEWEWAGQMDLQHTQFTLHTHRYQQRPNRFTEQSPVKY